jgi:hypothetical protein
MAIDLGDGRMSEAARWALLKQWFMDIRDHSGLPHFAKFAKRAVEQMETLEQK